MCRPGVVARPAVSTLYRITGISCKIDENTEMERLAVRETAGGVLSPAQPDSLHSLKVVIFG